VKIFVAEIGAVAVAAKAFADLEAASGGFREKSLRYLWESDVERPRLKPGFVIREATELEAQGWRNGRATAIRDGHNLDPGMNPELTFWAINSSQAFVVSRNGFCLLPSLARR
jgi:hypothetical protein